MARTKKRERLDKETKRRRRYPTSSNRIIDIGDTLDAEDFKNFSELLYITANPTSSGFTNDDQESNR